MNFLGHAYIARDFPQLIAGNFAGDSYKGKIDNFQHLPEHILNGIRLHRYIDDYTDHSEHILNVGRLFRDEGVQKVGLIATDIILDHYLSKNWKEYSSKTYQEFVEYVYQHTDPHLHQLEADFNWLYGRLKEYGWLYDYPSEKGITKILRQFSRRIGFENDLMLCMEIYQEKNEEIDRLFKSFMVEILSDSQQFILDNLK